MAIFFFLSSRACGLWFNHDPEAGTLFLAPTDQLSGNLTAPLNSFEYLNMSPLLSAMTQA